MSKKKKDPFALLKSLGFDDIPSADELAKVDEATGAKLLSQAMHATNVRKLQTAESKRDSREPVTSNAGIFGSLLTQAVGRNDASRAMKTLESDAKTGAAAQKAIAAFDRDLAMGDRKNELAGNNLDLLNSDLDRKHAMELQRRKDAAANQRNQATIASKQLEDNKTDPMTEKQLFDARTKLSDNASLLEVETDNLVRTMDFRTKNPEVTLPVGVARRIEREVQSGVLTKGEILKELTGKNANTVTYKLNDVGTKEGKKDGRLTREDMEIDDADLSPAQLQYQREAAERAFQEAGGLGGSILEFRDRVDQILNGKGDEQAHFRSEMQNKIAGEVAAERMTSGTMKITDEGQSAEESLRMSGPQKHLYNLTSRLVMASVKRMSGAEVTNFQLDKYSGLLGLKPGQTAHDQINALNDQARELEVMWSTLRSGYGQVIPDYVAGNPNTYLNKEIPRMDPGPIGEQETLYPVGSQAKHDSDIADEEGVQGRGYRDLGEFTGSQTFEQVGGNAVKEIGDDAGDLMNDIGGAVKKGASAIGRGVKGAWNAVTGQDDQSSMLPQAGAAMQQRQPPMARPPMPGQGQGNFPKAMDIFKEPQNQEQANSLAQTIAILQSQSQLNA
jgi:hypothetical protein